MESVHWTPAGDEPMERRMDGLSIRGHLFFNQRFRVFSYQRQNIPNQRLHVHDLSDVMLYGDVNRPHHNHAANVRRWSVGRTCFITSCLEISHLLSPSVSETEPFAIWLPLIFQPELLRVLLAKLCLEVQRTVNAEGIYQYHSHVSKI